MPVTPAELFVFSPIVPSAVASFGPIVFRPLPASGPHTTRLPPSSAGSFDGSPESILTYGIRPGAHIICVFRRSTTVQVFLIACTGQRTSFSGVCNSARATDSLLLKQQGRIQDKNRPFPEVKLNPAPFVVCPGPSTGQAGMIEPSSRFFLLAASPAMRLSSGVLQP